jgi:hypothetical protein
VAEELAAVVVDEEVVAVEFDEFDFAGYVGLPGEHVVFGDSWSASPQKRVVGLWSWKSARSMGSRSCMSSSCSRIFDGRGLELSQFLHELREGQVVDALTPGEIRGAFGGERTRWPSWVPPLLRSWSSRASSKAVRAPLLWPTKTWGTSRQGWISVARMLTFRGEMRSVSRRRTNLLVFGYAG